MKIAINTRFLLKDKLEGIGRFTYELCKELVANHPEDEFIFFFDRPYDASFIFAKNIKPVVLFPPARHPLLWYAWFELAIPKALQKYQADVFFSPDGYLSLSSKVKTVIVIHDIAHVHYPDAIPLLVKKYYNHYVPKFLKRADGIITVSNFVKKDIQAIYGVEATKISVACNSCSAIFKPIDEVEKEKIKTQFTNGQDYFLYTGAIHPRKNVDNLVKAFDLFKTKTGAKDQLLLVGRLAWKTEAVEQAIQQSPYKKDIQVLGFVEEVVLPKLLATAKAFVLISKHEGFGIPLLEAMQSEVPIICSNQSALPEVAGEAALAVDPNNNNEIAKALEMIWRKPELRKALIQKGLIQNKKFTWKKAAKVVYQKLSDDR